MTHDQSPGQGQPLGQGAPPQAPVIAEAPVVTARNLTHYFRRKCALDSVSFSIPRGCVTAILGRNGSGKTTLIRMLLGLLEPTRGSATVLGHDSSELSPEVRGRIGYLAEGHPLYGWMSVRDLARFQSSYYPKRWNQTLFDEVTSHFMLSPKARAGSLSRGERAGLALALTLAAEPELIVLDDPALGLDPVARRALLEFMVQATRRQERTIVFSSHLLSDVERVADRILILDRSVLRADASIETFRDRVRQYVLQFVGEVPPIPALPGLLHVRREAGELCITVANPTPQVEAALRALRPAALEEAPISFDDAVIGYMGYRGHTGTAVGATTAVSVTERGVA